MMRDTEYKMNYLRKWPGVMPYARAVEFLQMHAAEQRQCRDFELASVLEQASLVLRLLRMHRTEFDLPSDGEWVLCYNEKNSYLLAKYDWFESCWADQLGITYRKESVKSWMSLKPFRMLNHAERESNLEAIRRMDEEWFIDLLLILSELHRKWLDVDTLWCDERGGYCRHNLDGECGESLHRDCIRRWLHSSLDGSLFCFIREAVKRSGGERQMLDKDIIIQSLKSYMSNAKYACEDCPLLHRE